MTFKVGDLVKQKYHMRKPIGTVIHVYEKENYITTGDGKQILFAGPGDYTVNFDSPVRDDRGSVLNSSQLEIVS